MNRRKRILSLIILGSLLGANGSEICNIKAFADEENTYLKSADMDLNNAFNINKDVQVEENSKLKISVLSDIHYFSNSMIKDCDDFTRAESRDRKLLRESSAILDRSLERIREEKPDVLLITGDLTKDGEKTGHEEVAAKLKKLQMDLKSEGKELNIYVINGNHDINNSDAEDFSSRKAVKAAKTTASDFKNIYKSFCYDVASDVFTPSNGQAGSLSYVISPKSGFTFIAVDSCKYSRDNTYSGKDEHETDGAVSNELKQWVKDQAKEAKAKGDTVILLQHHGLVPHFDEEPEILGEYLVDNYDEINKEYADAGIRYAFTGHMHSNDISSLTTDSGNDLYDIETGSAVTYPCPMRNIELTRERNYENENKVKETVNITTELINNINYIDKETGKNIDNLKNYSYKNCIKNGFFITNAQDLIKKNIDNIKKEGGLKNYLSSRLKEDLGDYVIDALSANLPSNLENAMDVDGKAKVYFDNLNKRIVIKGVSFYSSGTLYITSDNIKKEVVNSIMSQIDSKILNNTDYVNKKVSDIVLGLLNTTLYNDGTNNKTVNDLFNYVYLNNLAGDEKIEPWVKNCADNFKNTKNINVLLNVLSKDISAIITENASQLTFNADKIVSRESGFTSLVMRGIVVKLLGNNLSDIIKIGKVNVNEKVDNAVNTYIDGTKRSYYGALASNVIQSMSTDTNYVEDNNTVIKEY